jgi:hypothetical protein
MDQFDYIEPTYTGKRIFNLILNFLTVIILLSTCCLVGFLATIFVDPNLSLNPFPPPAMPTAAEMPTLTPTALNVLPSTWTPIPTETPLPTYSPPTDTPFPTETPVITPTVTPTGTVSTSVVPFELSNGSPVAIASLGFHPEAGCNWMGVAGQVLDMTGAPISTSVVVHLGGILGGENKDITSLSGTAKQYGDAGYEIVLTSKPIASEGTLWVQLLDQAGLPLSGQVYFDTNNTCDKNLVFINFRQVR